MNKQDYLQWASFMQKCVYLQKIFKFLLFKMVEKAVRTALPELNPFFSEAVWKPGRSKVVCFTDMASIILSEQWYKDRKENFNDEKVRITTAAANSIENEKICKWYKTNVYRIVNQFSCWIPPPLPSNSKIVNDSFSGTRFKTDIIGAMYFKSNKIEQYYTSFIIWIKSRNRPRYGTLLTEISKLGYAIPCDEVKRRKKTGWIKTTN